MTSENQETRTQRGDKPRDSQAYGYSAPEQMAAVAALFGLPPPGVEKARVLELGAGSGGNLIPFALRHPGSKVVGVEASGTRVADGRAYIARLGIENASLVEADIIDVDPASLGEFDFIIVHGMYSHVSPRAQDAVLDIVGRCLSADGIAFVSYNTYPGWKAKEILRDAMLMHGGKRDDAEEQVAYGRAMVGFLQKTVVKGGSTDAALNENMALVMGASAGYLAEEFLAQDNLPCYFHEFMERADKRGLAYLGEAQPSMMMPSNYGQELAQQLYGALGEDQVRVEQYLDFAIGRSFRQTLLMRRERASQLQWRMDRETLRRMHFSANLSCVDGPAKLDGKPQEFVALPGGRRISVALSGIKRAIEFLSNRWPATATHEELLLHAGRTQGDADADAISPEILNGAIDELLEILVLRGMARIRLDPVEMAGAGEGGGGLVVDPLVRRQAIAMHPTQERAANAWHDPADIGDMERLLMPAMDGSRDRGGLVAIIADALREGRLSPSGPEMADSAARAEAMLDAMLQRMRESAVLLRQAQ
jgi:SAM-dependent methyltransferase